MLTFLIAQAIWGRDYPRFECIMNLALSRQDLDNTRLECRPECEQKLWWACGLKPRQRYKPLIQFARKHGLEPEAKRWEEMQKLIGAGPK